MSEWQRHESQSLERMLDRVLAEKRFWPTDRSFDLVNALTVMPATEVAIIDDADRLLLQYRLFSEWPKPYDKAGWYIPGGYVRAPKDLHMTALAHIRKDLKTEYERVNLEFNVESIEITKPLVIGVREWKPGEHPHGQPISLVCVAKLAKGSILETKWLKWANKPIPTSVPCHYDLQKQVFFFLKSSPKYRRWLQKMADIGYGVA